MENIFVIDENSLICHCITIDIRVCTAIGTSSKFYFNICAKTLCQSRPARVNTDINQGGGTSL